MTADTMAGSAPGPASKKRTAIGAHVYNPAVYSGQKWARFLDRCLATRLPVERFAQFASLQQRKYPVAASVLADLLLRPRNGAGRAVSTATATMCDAFIDPRIPAYLQVLLQLQYVDVTAVLRALYRYSTSQRAAQRAAAARRQQQNVGSAETKTEEPSKDGPTLWANSYAHEETTFYRITRAVRQGAAMQTRRDALTMAQDMAAWMDLFTLGAADMAETAQAAGAAETSVLADTGGRDMTTHEKMQEEVGAARAAFVMLLLAVLENTLFCATVAMPGSRGVRKALVTSLGGFVPLISLTPTPITLRLEQFRTEALASLGGEDAVTTGTTGTMGTTGTTGYDMVLQNLAAGDVAVVNSRAGLYIYLNASLVGRPLVDDTELFAYLHNRYQGDLQTTAIDLILAAFDVLANAVFRTEVHTSVHLLRSFLLNKVPLLLATLATMATMAMNSGNGSLYAFNAEYCISEALSRVDANAFPTMSSMFDDSQTATPLTDSARQDFCFACCLHGLIAEGRIETLLGEITYQTLPAAGRLTKEQLVQQCLGGAGGTGDADGITAVVALVDGMDGNAGAACQAVVAVLGQLCARRETATLRVLCSQLVRRPLAFDVLLLFARPGAVVWPLCRLLDTWRHDEDQGEYQPAYEEFGAALFLLLAFVHRYGLTAADLGVQWAEAGDGQAGDRPAGSFVARLLTAGHLGRPLAELSDAERDSLGDWIRGLFDTDAGGLSDDLMSACAPQQFYLLAPTLFQQIVQAVSSNALSEEMLKCGIEYLVDTFLLPSLATALIYLADMLRVERLPEQRAILRVLHLILQPASISSEATVLLTALLSVVAQPLDQALRTYQRLDPKSQEVDPLLRVLKPSVARSRRTAAAEHGELTFGSTSHHGGLAAALRQTMQGFVQWGQHPGVHMMPTWYTHRQFLAGLALLGAPRLLQLIVDELQRQVAGGDAHDGHGGHDAGGADNHAAGVAYDVACALVCAPDVTNTPSPALLCRMAGDDERVPNPVCLQRRISLREALAARVDDVPQLRRSGHPADTALADTLVRLQHRVAAQMAPPPPAAVAAAAAAAAVDLAGGRLGDLTSDLAGDLTGDLTGGLGLDGTDAAVAAAALDGASMEHIAVAAAQAAVADAGHDGHASDAMALDGVDPTVPGTTAAAAAAAAAAAGNDLDDLGDLGDLGSLEDLGDMDSLDLGDQSVFANLDLLNSWIDLQ